MIGRRRCVDSGDRGEFQSSAVTDLTNGRLECMTTPQDHNRKAWDAARRSSSALHAAGRGRRLSPTRWPWSTRPDGWENRLPASTLLCLASGGGRQGALYAAAGAQVTVVDVSPEMLAIDRQVAAERGLSLRTVEASMDDLSALAPASFDHRDPTGQHLLRARHASRCIAKWRGSCCPAASTSVSTSSPRVCRHRSSRRRAVTSCSNRIIAAVPCRR